MLRMHFFNMIQFSDQTRMSSSHPVALSAASGSFSSLILWLIKDFAFSNDFAGPPLSSLDICPAPEVPLTFWTGLICGFALYPLVEILVLTKQWLVLALKAKIARFSGAGKLYRVLE